MSFLKNMVVMAITVSCAVFVPLSAFALSTSTCETVYSGKSKGDFKGEASIVYFYMGDDPITTLAQETVDLSQAFSGADRKILLLDTKESSGTKFLKSKAISQANEVLAPTSDNFLNAIQDAVDDGYVVNVWIFSHGSYYLSHGKEITYFVGQDGLITSEDIASLKPAGCGQLPIRMVYTIACFNEGMNDEWRALGAKVVSGAPGINFYPTQYGRFVSDWNKGINYGTALTNSNTAESRTVVQAYVAALGLKYSNKGDCGLIPNVIGKNDCAEWYFTGGGDYDFGDEYDASLSGASNMNWSSKKTISGTSTVTKTSSVSWSMSAD
jgi:hypothetical protein